MDEKVSFDRVQQFIKNFSKKHQGISNLYVFTSVDRDGNVVDEKYGMNLMTRQGFNEIYADGVEFSARDTSNNTVKLYVGTGENVSQYTILDTDLEIPAFGGAPAINYDTTKAFDYPMYFSKGENDGEGFITLISRFLIAYYDFNIDNYPGQYALTEYGIKHNNTLWTHSRIYDIRGERATMLKDDNTQLWITVYMCLSFYESIIMNGWNHNRFTVITQNNIMYDRMGWNTRVKVYKRGNRVIDLTPGNPSRTQSTIETSIFRNSVVAPEAILYDNNSDTYQTNTKVLGCGYIDGFTLSEEGFIVVEPQSLATSEDITCVNNPKGRSDDKYVATSHEYILIYKVSYEFVQCKFFLHVFHTPSFKGIYAGDDSILLVFGKSRIHRKRYYFICKTLGNRETSDGHTKVLVSLCHMRRNRIMYQSHYAVILKVLS